MGHRGDCLDNAAAEGFFATRHDLPPRTLENTTLSSGGAASPRAAHLPPQDEIHCINHRSHDLINPSAELRGVQPYATLTPAPSRPSHPAEDICQFAGVVCPRSGLQTGNL
jgi:hypothetical protein